MIVAGPLGTFDAFGGFWIVHILYFMGCACHFSYFARGEHIFLDYALLGVFSRL